MSATRSTLTAGLAVWAVLALAVALLFALPAPTMRGTAPATTPAAAVAGHATDQLDTTDAPAEPATGHAYAGGLSFPTSTTPGGR